MDSFELVCTSVHVPGAWDSVSEGSEFPSLRGEGMHAAVFFQEAWCKGIENVLVKETKQRQREKRIKREKSRM